MPVGEAPHKAIEPEPGRETRFELCRLAAGGDAEIEASRLEIDRDGPSYTLDTLIALRAGQPERELVLLMGGDQAASLPQWRAPERLLDLATLAVVERDGARREQVAEAIRSLAGAERIRYVDMPQIEISSTLVRERVAAGGPFRHLVPDRVAERIHSAGLYRAGLEQG